jgi:branched-chain amino acid transport system ATP-binding protein
MLVVEDLTKKFGGFTAVNGISFEVKRGEIIGLIGPNGSGKSTTFNVLAGLFAPTSGAVTCLLYTSPSPRD